MRYLLLFLGVPLLFFLLMGIGLGLYISLGISVVVGIILNRKLF